MKGKIKVTEKDHGWDRFMSLQRIKHSSVRVGVLGDEGKGAEKRDGGYTNAEIAAVHEFGTADGRIPERSFMRSTFTKNQDKYYTRTRSYLLAIAQDKMGVEKALNLLGLEMANDMKKTIVAGLSPPNAPATIERKLGIGKSAHLKVDIALAAEAVDDWADRDAWAPRQIAEKGRNKGKVVQSREGRTLQRKLSSAVNAYHAAAGKVKPLIDTGRMMGALTWAVEIRDLPPEQRGAK